MIIFPECSLHMQDLKDVTNEVLYENYRSVFVAQQQRTLTDEPDKLLKQKEEELRRMEEQLQQMRQVLEQTRASASPSGFLSEESGPED